MTGPDRRPSMKSTLLSVALLTSVLPAQGVAWWAGTWDDAVEDARRRNVPLIVAFVMDNEEANDRVVAGLYKDDAFIKATERAVAILACPNTHKPIEQKINGKNMRVCSKFGHATCEAHKQMEMEVRLTFWPDGRVATPTHIIVLPDDTKVGMLSDVMPTGSYVSALKTGRTKLGGRGLTRVEYAQAIELLEQAKAAIAADDYAGSVALLATFDKRTMGTPLAEDALAVRTALGEKGVGLVARAEAAAGSGDWIGALRLLRGGMAAFRGTDLFRILKKADSRLSKTKEGRVAVKLLKAEDRARPSFDKARKHEQERDYVRAVKAYFRVLSLAAGSPLAAEARSRLAALKADGEVAPLVSKVMASQEAELELKEARALLRQRKRDEARAKLQRIVKDWPATSAAAKARKLLESDG